MRDIQIPIEYYGIDEDITGKKFIVEKEFSVLEYEIDEIVRVHGEIINKVNIQGKDIRGNEVIYILANLLLTIEYVSGYKDDGLRVISYNIPIYCSLSEDRNITDINTRISSLHVNNYNKERIYIYSVIIVY